MQCKKCGYHLWNIQGRTCPECGTGFDIIDYDFVPNAVAFCCPHCDQQYFGTDDRGHLEPPAFECITCQNQLVMNQMILKPGPGYKLDDTTVNEHPWENRGDKPGTIRAWYRTSIAAMLKAPELVKFPPEQDKRAGHWGFLILNNFITSFLGFGSVLIFSFLFLLVAGPGGGNTISMMGGFAAAGIVILMLASVIANLISVCIWGAVTHLMLRLLGEPQGDMTDTYRCFCYSNGTTAMVAVPVCGPYILSSVASVWWIVSAIQMLMQVHKTSGMKTTLAVLTIPILMIGLVIILMACLPLLMMGMENIF